MRCSYYKLLLPDRLLLFLFLALIILPKVVSADNERMSGPNDVRQGRSATFNLFYNLPSGQSGIEKVTWKYKNGSTTTTLTNTNLSLSITYTANVCIDTVRADLYYYKFDRGVKVVSKAYPAKGGDRYGRSIDGIEFFILCLKDIGPIQGPSQIASGNTSTVTYSVEDIGTSGLEGSISPSQYIWTYPTGWTAVSGAQSRSITLQPNAGSGGTVSVSARGPSGTNYTVGPSSKSVTRTGPVIACTDNVFVQNSNAFAGTKNSGNNLYAGRAVTNTLLSGEVVVRSGATAKFVARGDIFLEDGFSVEEGANFSTEKRNDVCSSFSDEETNDALVLVDTSDNNHRPSEAHGKLVREGLEIYPNPVNNEMTVLLPDGNGRDARIYNSFGEEVMHLTLQEGLRIVDTHALKPGIYYIHTQSKEGFAKTRFRVER